MARYLMTAIISTDGSWAEKRLERAMQDALTNRNVSGSSEYGITDILSVSLMSEEKVLNAEVTVAGVENKPSKT